MDITTFSEKELKEKFQEIIHFVDYQNTTPVKNPTGYVLGGLAGSGKSMFTKSLNNTVIIIGDDYRLLHPRFKEIQAQYGDNWVFKTNAFVSAMVEKVTQQAVTDSKNLVIEGTFRTYKAPASTLEQLKKAGYETHAHIVICQKDIAWYSTIARYKYMEQSGLYPRKVTSEKFQEMLDNLSSTADKIKNSGLADHFTMSARFDIDNIADIYDSEINKENPSIIINKELYKELTSKERYFVSQYIKNNDIDRNIDENELDF